MLNHRFWTFIPRFWPVFGPFWALIGHYWSISHLFGLFSTLFGCEIRPSTVGNRLCGPISHLLIFYSFTINSILLHFKILLHHHLYTWLVCWCVSINFYLWCVLILKFYFSTTWVVEILRITHLFINLYSHHLCYLYCSSRDVIIINLILNLNFLFVTHLILNLISIVINQFNLKILLLPMR